MPMCNWLCVIKTMFSILVHLMVCNNILNVVLWWVDFVFLFWLMWCVLIKILLLFLLFCVLFSFLTRLCVMFMIVNICNILNVKLYYTIILLIFLWSFPVMKLDSTTVDEARRRFCIDNSLMDEELHRSFEGHSCSKDFILSLFTFWWIWMYSDQGSFFLLWYFVTSQICFIDPFNLLLLAFKLHLVTKYKQE